MKKIMSLFLSAAMVLGLSGCGSMNNTTKMGLGGAGVAQQLALSLVV